VLTECKLKARETAYYLMDHFFTIYVEIEELEHLYHDAFNPYLMSQLVNYGLNIIKSTNNFETSIHTWIVRLVNDHTWPNFKTHFDEAHHILRIARGTTIRSAT